MSRTLLSLLAVVGLACSCWADVRFNLETAARAGDLPRLRLLLQQEPDQLGFLHGDALRWASAAGREEVVAWLLGHPPAGADITYDAGQALCLAAEGNHTRVMAKLLDYGADISATDERHTDPQVSDPLLIALRAGHVAAATLLLDRGADPNHALRYARQHRLSPEFVRLLIAHGARNPDMDYACAADPPPLLAGDAGMVPVVPFAEWMGAPFVADAETGILTVTLKGRTIRLTVGRREARFTGEGSVTLPAAPLVKDGAIYVPLRALIAGLHLTSDWNARGLTVTIHHPQTGEALVVGLADPDPPARPETRRLLTSGTLYIVEPGGPAIFAMREGKQLLQASVPPGTTAKYYSIAGFAGAPGRPWRSPRAFDFVTRHGDWLMGITGRWNAQPRPVHREDPADPRLPAAVRALLTAKGLAPDVPVVLTDAVRGDLAGDGGEEVLACGTYDADPKLTQNRETAAGTPHPFYSFVVLWRAKEAALSLLHVDGMFATSQQANYAWYALAGVLDLNADGVMEYVLASDHYGADSAYNLRTAYRLSGDRVTQVGQACWGE